MTLLLGVESANPKLLFQIKDLAQIWNTWITSMLTTNNANAEKMIGSWYHHRINSN